MLEVDRQRERQRETDRETERVREIASSCLPDTMKINDRCKECYAII